MLGRKGILNDASNVHVMSKPTQIPIYYSTNKYAIPPIAKHKGKRRKSVPQIGDTQTVDWGDDNQITIWNQIEKEFPRAGLRAE